MKQDAQCRVNELLQASKEILDLVYEICPFEGSSTRRLQKAIKEFEDNEVYVEGKHEGK